MSGEASDTRAAPAVADAALRPEAGGLALPVEIISLAPRGGAPGRIVRSVTGRTVPLPAGDYLVQIVLPATSQSGISSRAERVELQAGATQSVDLQEVMRETTAALIQAFAEKIERGMGDSAPPVAVAILRGVQDGLNEQTGATTTPSVDLTLPEEKPWFAFARNLARRGTQALLVSKPVLGIVEQWLSHLKPSALLLGGGETAVAGIETSGGEPGPAYARQAPMAVPASVAASAIQSDAPAIRSDAALVQSGAAATAGAAPDVRPAEIGLLDADVQGLLQSGLDKSRTAGFQPLATLRVGDPEWQTEIAEGRRHLVICGQATQAVAIIPVDPLSGPTKVAVALLSAAPPELTGLLQQRAYPRLTVSFALPAVSNLWLFMSASAFDESRQLAAAQVDDLLAVGPSGTGTSLAALLAAYVLLRANQLDRLEPCLQALEPCADQWPDVRIISAESLARRGLHPQAVRMLAALPLAPCPLFRPGVTYALQRLRLYRRLDSGGEQDGKDGKPDRLQLDAALRERLAALEAPLAGLAAVMDPTRLNLVLFPQQRAPAASL